MTDPGFPQARPDPTGEPYAEMFEAAGVGLLRLSQDGVVRLVNPAGAAFLGRSVAELTGMNVLEITHPEDIAPTLSALGDVLADRSELAMVEKRYLRPDGSVVWSRSRVSRLPLPDGGLALLAVVADITQLKETQLALRQAHRALEDSVEASLLSLGIALEARDLETQGHTERVVALSILLGTALGLGPAALEALRHGAYLHDIGKLGVPDAVLLKPGKLGAHEWTLMQSHAVRGHEIARHIPLLTPGALSVIRHHHERWDGSG